MAAGRPFHGSFVAIPRSPLCFGVMFSKEGRIIRFRSIRQSMMNDDIASGRKLAVFMVLVAAIILGIVHFCVYFDFEAASRQLYASISAMVGITAVAQLVGSWFVYQYRVPTYLLHIPAHHEHPFRTNVNTNSGLT